MYKIPAVKSPRKPRPFALTRPTVPESAVLAAVLEVLAYHPAVAWAGRFNSGAMRVGAPGRERYVRFNGVPGLSDILGQLKTGAMLAIECKRLGEHPTLEQQGFLDLVNRHGGLAFCARSAEDVIVQIPRHAQARMMGSV